MKRIMIETMIALKNKLEPTLILQSVNDVTNCKRETLFFSFYKLYAVNVNPTQIESRDQKNSQDQESSFFCQILTNQSMKIRRRAWPTRDHGEQSQKQLSSLPVIAG